MNNRGPRSAAGKAAVALNHLKHGLGAAAIVLPSENPEEWHRFHEAVRTQLGTDDDVEATLASRVAELLWRLRRVVRAEQQFVSVDQMHRDISVHDRAQQSRARGIPTFEQQAATYDDSEESPPEVAVARAEIQRLLGQYAAAYVAGEASSRYEETLPVLIPNDRALDKIMKYEVHLSRLLNHALHELQALQDRRRGVATPLTRIDVT